MNIPESLSQGVAAGKIVPFVGSGASLAVKPDLFPTWKEVLATLGRRLEAEGLNSEKVLVDTKTSMGRLFEAAEEAYNGLGRDQFSRVMQSLFHKEQPADADLTLQKLVWEVNANLVVTTNYDSALLWANPNANALLNNQRQDLAGIVNQDSGNLPRVWHIHGHIGNSESLILAPSQYENLYQANQLSIYAAAQKQLEGLVANRPLLFTGFGMQDQYVMEMLSKVFETFSGGLQSSYALLKKGDNASQKLWERHGIRVVNYEDHGEPLISLVQGILEVKTRQTQIQAPEPAAAESRVPTGAARSTWPGCALSQSQAKASDFGELFQVLEDCFAFRWEPESFVDNNNPVVYWPVRLREPSAIHAVQSFAAASLARQGARVVLCLDNFGYQKYDPLKFVNRVKRWFKQVGVDSDALDSRKFTDILETNDAKVAWNHVQAWLGGDSYNLETVLRICKLYKVGMGLEEYMSKGTGRLLTPGVVWACLRHLIDEFPGQPLLTLGGHDERNLWSAWRERISQGDPSVGHLYIPELSNTHMETTNLKWTAKCDVQSTFEQKLAEEGSESEWYTENSIIPWSLRGCVFLPEYLADPDGIASKLSIDPAANPGDLVRPTVDAVASWIF